jgi:protein-L-isoaspartate O-methyltransferase
MIEGLDVREGEFVLDIGSGCGVTSAILAYLVRAYLFDCVCLLSDALDCAPVVWM